MKWWKPTVGDLAGGYAIERGLDPVRRYTIKKKLVSPRKWAAARRVLKNPKVGIPLTLLPLAALAFGGTPAMIGGAAAGAVTGGAVGWATSRRPWKQGWSTRRKKYGKKGRR